MRKRDGLSKALVVLGTVLVSLPLLLPVVFGVVGMIARPAGVPANFDYLMPFEVYPVTLVGVALLAWGSLRSHVRRAAVGISIAGMLGGIVLAAIAAQVTGIASSVERLETWRYVLTASLGGISLIAQAALIVIGFLIAKDLFSTPQEAPEPTPIVPAV